jgi:hypothetical protein
LIIGEIKYAQVSEQAKMFWQHNLALNQAKLV